MVRKKKQRTKKTLTNWSLYERMDRTRSPRVKKSIQRRLIKRHFYELPHQTDARLAKQRKRRPLSAAHKKKISEALKRHHRNRRKAADKKRGYGFTPKRKYVRPAW